MMTKLHQILIDLKHAYRMMQESRNDAMVYSFNQRRFIGYLRALAEFQQSATTTKEYWIAHRVLKYYLSKL